MGNNFSAYQFLDFPNILIYFFIENNNKEPKDNLEAHETNLVTTDLSNGQSHVDQSISYSKITEHSNLDQTTSVARANNLSPRNLEVDDISDKFEMLGQEDQENQTDLWINSNTKKCPKCSISIEVIVLHTAMLRVF